MRLFRKAAVIAGISLGILAVPAAAMAHDRGYASGTSAASTVTCTQGGQYSSGTNVGLINLGNLGLSVLTNPAIALLGIAGTNSSQAVACGNNS